MMLKHFNSLFTSLFGPHLQDTNPFRRM